MRRASLTKHTKDRHRDDTVAPQSVAAPSVIHLNTLDRDGALKAVPHKSPSQLESVQVPPSTVALAIQPPTSISASNPAAVDDATYSLNTILNRHLDQDHRSHTQPQIHIDTTVPATAPDASVTDTFPAEFDAVSAAATDTVATIFNTSAAVANTSTPASSTSSLFVETVEPLRQDPADGHIVPSVGCNTTGIDQQELDSDSDIDLDLDLEASIPPSLDSLLLPNYSHYHDIDQINGYELDYDVDMSDSDGGAPLDDDISPPPDYYPQQFQPSNTYELDNGAQVHHSASISYPLQHHHHQYIPSLGAGVIMDTPLPPNPWGPDPLDFPTPPQLLPEAPIPPEDDLDGPLLISNPNPTVMGFENPGLIDFLRHWAHQARMSSPLASMRFYAPLPEDIRRQARASLDQVTYDMLHGDYCDMQGMNWTAMGTTRRHAREQRRATYRNYVNQPGSDQWHCRMSDANIQSPESFFRFQKYSVRRDVHLAHFQLRSVLACPSRTQAYYSSTRGVHRINPVSSKSELALDISNTSGLGAHITTLDANHGVLLAGTFIGEYYLKNIDSDQKRTFSYGNITPNYSGITNHIQIHLPRRSGGPVAAISSNDEGFRVMDLTTEKFIMEAKYRFSLNCSRVSPDGRLRVMVGDDFRAMVTDVETGQIQQELAGHRDFGFACDWSDDGWTIATGFQDKGVKIWDARRWCNANGIGTPLCTIRSEMSGVRNLRFSPVGSGPRVLVAAEEADYVNMIDAQTFRTKQTVDIFGETGGVAFTNDDQNLNVLVSDQHRGGLLQLERCGGGPEPYWDNSWRRYPDGLSWRNNRDNGLNREKSYSRPPISSDTMALF